MIKKIYLNYSFAGYYYNVWFDVKSGPQSNDMYYLYQIQ